MVGPGARDAQDGHVLANLARRLVHLPSVPQSQLNGTAVELV